ncbi:DUF6907 domain-containing protein [Streptomyces zhihengii]|uniref:DUF6907 domain-containing protein n=1 Tax=Streptomyces zhihengii TaxID=1818004 RepID=UPI0036431EF1
MSTVLPERPAVSAPLSTAAGSHPTPCPVWCMHRGDALAHNFGPTMTPHWGVPAVLDGPFHGVDGKGNLLQVELYRGDTGGELAEPTLYVRESGDELSASEVDLLIARLKSFTAQVEFLRAQMG